MFRLSPVAWHYILLQTDITNCFMSYRTVGNLSAVTLVSVVKYNCLGLFKWLREVELFILLCFYFRWRLCLKQFCLFRLFHDFSLILFHFFFWGSWQGQELTSDFYIVTNPWCSIRDTLDSNRFHLRGKWASPLMLFRSHASMTPKSNSMFVDRMNLIWDCVLIWMRKRGALTKK